jgi:hypothetical protein
MRSFFRVAVKVLPLKTFVVFDDGEPVGWDLQQKSLIVTEIDLFSTLLQFSSKSQVTKRLFSFNYT